MKNPIFVVGTGRSGTHFLTSVLISSPELTDLTGGKENLSVFHSVTSSFIEKRENSMLALAYENLVKEASPLRLVDQCHPNLWRSGEILKQFPDASFLCMVRDPFSVTFSTLNHRGVRGRLEGDKWKKYPLPSSFFGIEGPFIENYHSYKIVERSALRWCSHMREVDRCVKLHKSSFLPVSYESLLTNPSSECDKIVDFLKVGGTLNIPNPKTASLKKKDGLTNVKVERIKNIIIDYFSYFGFHSESVVPIKRYLQI